MTWLWVMLGSALGGVARYWLSGLAAHHIGETFPIGTLIVNVTGSFIIGFVATLTGPDGRVFVGTDGRQFMMTGVCGSGLVTLEKAQVLQYGADVKHAPA